MMIAPQRKKNKSIVSVAHFTDFFNRKKTFRPRKRFAPGTMRHCLHKRAERSMLSGVDLDSVVKLPTGEALEDWIAVHVVDFFNRINLIFATVYDYCTPSTCPVMNGGARYEYYWMDGKNYRKPTALPASRYIELVLEWIETSINDERQFPTSTDVPFPSHFISLAQKIFSRLYRVFVHLFIHHYEVLVYLNAEAPVLTCYRHFYRFIIHFNLVSERELSPLLSFSAKVCGASVAELDEDEQIIRDTDQCEQTDCSRAVHCTESCTTSSQSAPAACSFSDGPSSATKQSSCTTNSSTSSGGSPPLLLSYSTQSSTLEAQSKSNCNRPTVAQSSKPAKVKPALDLNAKHIFS